MQKGVAIRKCSRANIATPLYYAALKLVELIDQRLATGTGHYRDRNGRLLTDLGEVVQAIISGHLEAGDH